ncbi:MAG: hypothetical protein H8E44_00150 [Planctomycetes bacterium]|nr:hypothetical protein [Planctomycetota bacterium]
MKAVGDTYRKRSMDELADLAIEILRQHNGQPLGCGYIGERLFPGAIHRGSAPFARIAGRAMKRLERDGKAKWGKLTEYGSQGWYAT